MKTLLIGFLFVAAGGGGSRSPAAAAAEARGDSSGVPRASTVGSLSSTDAATLCDWLAAEQGGYGRMVTCSDGSTRTTDTNQAICVAGSHAAETACPTLTVGEVRGLRQRRSDPTSARSRPPRRVRPFPPASDTREAAGDEATGFAPKTRALWGSTADRRH